MSFAHAAGEGSTETEMPALKVALIGVDPRKASLAVAALDEATGELLLLERASFPQDYTGLRRLERWAKWFPERQPKRWRTSADSAESVVDVSPKLSARVGVLSSFAGNARKNGWHDTREYLSADRVIVAFHRIRFDEVSDVFPRLRYARVRCL